MVKGIPIDILHNSIEANPLLLSYESSSSFVSLQDSLQKSNKSQVTNSQTASKIINNNTKVNSKMSHADSIFARSDARDHQIKIKKATPVVANIPVCRDTLPSQKVVALPAYEHQYVYPDNENFLMYISQKAISTNFDFSLLPTKEVPKFQLVQTAQTVKTKLKVHQEIAKPIITGREGTLRKESSISWLPLVLLFSLFTFSWIKIMYQKYILQVIISIVNYQVALRLLRERNVLFRNMSFGLNFIFILNLGLFIYLILDYFGVRQYFTSQILNFFICCLAVSIFFNVKNFFCVILGVIFKYQEEFLEYIHNENLFNKNIGLLLFPIVILLPYVPDNSKQFILFAGIIFFGIMILLRTLRGFQIIIRKGVSTFYMILYLCAVEILPVLILIKYSMTLI